MKYKNNNPFGVQAKMMFHQDRIYEYLYKGDTAPVEMEVNLTNKCNMSCKWCINANFRNKERLNVYSFMHFCIDFKKMGGKALVFSGGGEPTLHPDFEVFVNVARRSDLELGLMTNGFYKPEYSEIIGNNFKWVRFSIDTLDRKEYKKWKGVDSLDMVIDNVKALDKLPVKVGINCNVGPEHTVESIEKFGFVFSRGIDYIQFRPVLPRYFLKEKIQTNEAVWDYLSKRECQEINISGDKLEDLRRNNAFPFSSCEGHFFVPVLNANGDVCVCMYHPKDDRFVFGNLKNQYFKQIWQSEKRYEVIDFVRKLDYKKECQMCCKLTEINKFIDFIKHPEKGTDINFL